MFPPSLVDFERMADEAWQTVPEPLREFTTNVVLRIEDFVDEETQAEMGLESPFDLLGLYRGVSLDRKSVAATADDVDIIFLFRRPILDYWCETEEGLDHIIRHVLIHEIGHHFGLSDDDIDRIEQDP